MFELVTDQFEVYPEHLPGSPNDPQNGLGVLYLMTD
jgi:hypothetical protein